jgi:hypothetical protein
MIIFFSVNTILSAPKNVLTFVVPTTKMLHRIRATNRQISLMSTSQKFKNLLSQRHIKRPTILPCLYSASSQRSLSISANNDSDNKNIATTSSDNEKSAAELDAIKAARDARK